MPIKEPASRFEMRGATALLTMRVREPHLRERRLGRVSKMEPPQML
jgi:hypothetical protein